MKKTLAAGVAAVAITLISGSTVLAAGAGNIHGGNSGSTGATGNAGKGGKGGNGGPGGNENGKKGDAGVNGNNGRGSAGFTTPRRRHGNDTANMHRNQHSIDNFNNFMDAPGQNKGPSGFDF